MCKYRRFPLPGLKKFAVQPAVSLILVVLVLIALAPAFSQATFTFPSWLASYPGTHPKVYSSGSLAQESYFVDAEPMEVLEHYRGLFEAQGLPFQPNPDGMGTTIRLATKDCDLFIQVRRREGRTYTKVTCAGKIDAASMQAPENPGIEMITGVTPPPPPPSKGGGDQSPAAVKVNKSLQPMAAPPLVWPGWLSQVRGMSLRPTVANTPTGGSLKAQYRTDASTNEVYDFYRNLLMSHDYLPSSSLSTGASVEGVNYVDGAPGANSTIQVSIDRTALNGQIGVAVRFATHDYNPGGQRTPAKGSSGANKVR